MPHEAQAQHSKFVVNALDNGPEGVYCAVQQLLRCNMARSTPNRRDIMTIKESTTAITELTSKGLARMNALGEVNLKIADKVASRQMDAFNLMMEQGVRMMNLATEAKGYSDYYKGQLDAAKQISERMMAESKANMQVASEVRDEYRTWFDGAMADMRDSKDVVRNAVTA
jgi:hypothetical protein